MPAELADRGAVMRHVPLWLYSVRLLFHSTLGALHAVLIACACYGVCAPLYMPAELADRGAVMLGVHGAGCAGA